MPLFAVLEPSVLSASYPSPQPAGSQPKQPGNGARTGDKSSPTLRNISPAKNSEADKMPAVSDLDMDPHLPVLRYIRHANGLTVCRPMLTVPRPPSSRRKPGISRRPAWEPRQAVVTFSPRGPIYRFGEMQTDFTAG